MRRERDGDFKLKSSLHLEQSGRFNGIIWKGPKNNRSDPLGRGVREHATGNCYLRV